MNECLMNIVAGDTLYRDGSNLIDNLHCQMSELPQVGDTVVSKHYRGKVIHRHIDYSKIQHTNPDHNGVIFVFIFCEPL